MSDSHFHLDLHKLSSGELQLIVNLLYGESHERKRADTMTAQLASAEIDKLLQKIETQTGMKPNPKLVKMLEREIE